MVTTVATTTFGNTTYSVEVGFAGNSLMPATYRFVAREYRAEYGAQVVGMQVDGLSRRDAMAYLRHQNGPVFNGGVVLD